jgi:uncharacterized protein (DUF1015 family)
MARILDFPVIRPALGRAAQVASVPYDVVDTEEARRLAEGNPHSFLHIVRSEIDLPPTIRPYSTEVYERARSNLARLIDDGVMLRDSQPRMFLYRLVMNGREQTGVVCCCHIDDYFSDIIRKHELTRKDKEDDRTRHVLDLSANAEPVFLTYRDADHRADTAGPARSIRNLIERDSNQRPLYHFTAPDDVTHTVWEVPDAQPYVAAFGHVPVLYIADGHHRTASAARAGAERRDANPQHTGDERYNWFLSVIFPASELQILPYNRVVKDLGGMTPEQVLARFAEVGRITDCLDHAPQEPGSACFYWCPDSPSSGTWQRLVFDPDTIDYNDPIASLDVSLLQERVLRPIFNIGDVRTDKRIDFVGGIRPPEVLERRVNNGEAAIAFTMYPTTIEQLMAVADAGMVMPPKSTWFEPKLRSGLFVHPLD